MFKALFQSDLFILSRKQKTFSIYILLCIFLIMAEYGMSAPVSSSLFLSQYTAFKLPHVWLFTVPLNFILVATYNFILPRLGPRKTFYLTLGIVSLIHITTAIFASSFKALIFLQYAFRDIYILLLFKQIWSLIHSTMNVSKIKYLYSLPFIVGSIGAITGSMLPAYLTSILPSAKLFYLTPCFYLLLWFFYNKASKKGTLSLDRALFSQKAAGGFALIKNSSHLRLILSLVFFMQLTVAIAYFQFNLYLDQAFIDVDLRTGYMGKMHFFISSISLGMQVFISALLIRFLGLRRSHLLVPFTFSCVNLLFIFKPTLLTISSLYTTIKSLDFSFFCLIREKLYTPLSIDEKYRAKAIIDVFIYRSSKAIASVFLILFPMPLLSLSYVSSLLFLFWIVSIVWLFKKEAFSKKPIITPS